MLGKLDPTATAGRCVYFYRQAQCHSILFKPERLIPAQPEDEGTPAAHASALIHADIGS